MRMVVISSEGDLLPVLAVLLNSESDSQSFGNFGVGKNPASA